MLKSSKIYTTCPTRINRHRFRFGTGPITFFTSVALGRMRRWIRLSRIRQFWSKRSRKKPTVVLLLPRRVLFMRLFARRVKTNCSARVRAGLGASTSAGETRVGWSTACKTIAPGNAISLHLLYPVFQPFHPRQPDRWQPSGR